MQGKVKWFSSEKGYGFITSNSGDDHYFNVQAINGSYLPNSGDTVEFESKTGDKGYKAIKINIIAKAENKIQRQDDRINCPSCGKKIVPRIITYRGSPEKSVCPYCAATVKEFSKCFIATAVYDNASCNEVRELRYFRDNHLQKNKLGRLFVKSYYKISPPIAIWLRSKPNISSKVKIPLDIIVKYITKQRSE